MIEKETAVTEALQNKSFSIAEIDFSPVGETYALDYHERSVNLNSTSTSTWGRNPPTKRILILLLSQRTMSPRYVPSQMPRSRVSRTATATLSGRNQGQQTVRLRRSEINAQLVRWNWYSSALETPLAKSASDSMYKALSRKASFVSYLYSWSKMKILSIYLKTFQLQLSILNRTQEVCSTLHAIPYFKFVATRNEHATKWCKPSKPSIQTATEGGITAQKYLHLLLLRIRNLFASNTQPLWLISTQSSWSTILLFSCESLPVMVSFKLQLQNRSKRVSCTNTTI